MVIPKWGKPRSWDYSLKKNWKKNSSIKKGKLKVFTLFFNFNFLLKKLFLWIFFRWRWCLKTLDNFFRPIQNKNYPFVRQIFAGKSRKGLPFKGQQFFIQRDSGSFQFFPINFPRRIFLKFSRTQFLSSILKNLKFSIKWAILITKFFSSHLEKFHFSFSRRYRVSSSTKKAYFMSNQIWNRRFFFKWNNKSFSLFLDVF